MPDIAELFAVGGALERVLPGYRPRPGQVEMARQVETALAAGGQCVLEAGTGIGKTFAYLTPIIQSGMTALISTGARALQDQLSQRDIPLLAQALGRNVSLAVLKGRANYLCKQALANGGVGVGLAEGERDDWQKILFFAAETDDGDLRGITEVASDSPLLMQAVSTRESCNPHKCEHYKECFLYKARARAQQADIVIVNHHLFLSDMRLRDEGVAELLPARDVVLFDEAHLLAQLAPRFFGEQLSSTQLLRLLARMEQVVGGLAREHGALLAAGRAVKERLAQLLELSESGFNDSRVTAAAAQADADWAAAAVALRDNLKTLAQRLSERAGESEKIAQLGERALADGKTLADWLADDTAADDDEDGKSEKDEEKEDDPLVRWADYNKNSANLTLLAAPMTGRTLFAKQWQQLPTVLFTSATLSVGGDFQVFCEATGLATEQTHSWDSPYDFASHSLLYLPRQLPAPTAAAAHTAAVVEAALPLVRANGGRAFMLFSSWRALNSACEQLQPLLQADGIDILKQGDMPNDELLRRFRRETRVVLMGSQSFWQGVDVRGDSLSLVVVDKIPFIPPTDPLIKARDEWRKKQGKNPFVYNQLPPAVLLMKQVAGRLIRDYDDYGVFMIGDPRITSKGYGKTILNALPPMPRCTDGEQAVAFLRRFSEQRRAVSEGADE